MAALDENVDVGRDEWGTAPGIEHARAIRSLDGERGVQTIVGVDACLAEREMLIVW
jgi:hypothetical protein